MSKNTLKLETNGFEKMIDHLKELNGDIKTAVTDALEQSGETITDDTKIALKKPKLPAGGIYSTGTTLESVVSPKVIWIGGTQAEMGVGFDYSKPGAGGFLISGTPRMKPVDELQQVYKRKKYMRDIQQDMIDVVEDYIVDALKEGK